MKDTGGCHGCKIGAPVDRHGNHEIAIDGRVIKTVCYPRILRSCTESTTKRPDKSCDSLQK